MTTARRLSLVLLALAAVVAAVLATVGAMSTSSDPTPPATSGPARVDLADVLGTPPVTSTTTSAPQITAPPAAPATTSRPAARTTTPAATTTTAPPVIVEPAPAPVADPCFRADPECYDGPVVVDCLAGEEWDGTQCVAVQTDDERIGREVDGPNGERCTVVAVNPDRLDCTPHPVG